MFYVSLFTKIDRSYAIFVCILACDVILLSGCRYYNHLHNIHFWYYSNSHDYLQVTDACTGDNHNMLAPTKHNRHFCYYSNSRDYLQVTDACTGDNHNVLAPTKHNRHFCYYSNSHDYLQVTDACTGDNHNVLAPTKHNRLCNERSVTDVMLDHPDFSSESVKPINRLIVSIDMRVAIKNNF